MNAQELTKCYFDDHNKLCEADKNIDYLLQECSKLRREIDDLKIDIKMIQNMRR